ncbi:uncharacterized protein [Sinocyclocheilus grahami]|uniref:uncharacterized protein n=1 Tax=Sinocyclocheilus grahami TaxID=75366 RepID=UPI0007AD17D5|nr:PREDICTED: uncharacterized protein LOC107602276 [Sinocyclocheilus grahami]
MKLKYSIPQLLTLNNRTIPTCIAVVKELGLLRRPRYIHRSSRRNYQEKACSTGRGGSLAGPHTGPGHFKLSPYMISPQSLTPWYTYELRKMKTAERVLERHFMASGLPVHKQAYREHQKAYARLSAWSDDTQLYVRTNSTLSAVLPSSTLTTCLEQIKAWMKQNFLQLNSSKTEAILIGTPNQVRTSVINSITFSGQDISLSTSVTNLGVKMDLHLTFEDHIKHLCKTYFFHLRNIAKLRPMLPFGDAEKLVHDFVSSRLGYCNALLIGIPGKSLQKLQYIPNSAARILMRVRKYDHITPILNIS